MQILVNWLISTLAILAAAYLLPGIGVAGFGTAAVIAVILGLINITVRPIILFLTLPLNILTLGLLTFVINALMILLAAAIVPGFRVDSFWYALLFSLLLSVLLSALFAIFK